MSNIYINEPPTKGKILMQTTVGDIDIELWSKECPKACRNFVQLCMENYYNNTIFHRLVKNFIVQGGDPTGTGDGGESIYSQPFKDEFHSRLRFVRRGLVAMANSGPDNNGSQFFFTLAETRELDKKHTIFGKITGNTIYNMIKLNDSQIDGNERPLFPHKILKTEILSNPFDDIKPRQIIDKTEEFNLQIKKLEPKATKNFNLLSFGDEAAEEENDNVSFVKLSGIKEKIEQDEIIVTMTKKLTDTVNNDSDLELVKGKKQYTDNEENTDDEEERHAMKERIVDKLKKHKNEHFISSNKRKSKINYNNKLSSGSDNSEDDIQFNPEKRRKLKLHEMKREQERLKMEIVEKRNSTFCKPNNSSSENEEEIPDIVLEYRKNKKKFREERQQIKKGIEREKQTLNLLNSFQDKLSSIKKINKLLCGDFDTPVTEDDDGFSWMTHRLSFEEQNKKVLDANVKELDRYELFDPRNPINKRRREDLK